MRSFVLCVIVSAMAQSAHLKGSIAPIPLPKDVRIESAAPRGKVWEKLTEKQKHLAFHLMSAARVGRNLLFYQIHRHGLTVKAMLENSLSEKGLPETKKLLGSAFPEYLVYAAKFLDLGGPYANSNRKYVLSKVSADQVSALINKFAPKVSAETAKEIVRVLTDRDFEVQLYPESQDGEGLENTGGNLYAKGITGKDIKAVLDKSLKTTLNCRVIRTKSGLSCEIQTVKTPGIVGELLRQVVSSLTEAKAYSESELQKKQLEHMIRYFTNGDVEEFRQANIAWVKDGAKSTVDFMIGWVEVYEDWLARIGSWESYVQIVDPEISKLAGALASHAQYFENAMPYGEFKKKFPADYAPPAIMVYYFQEIANYRSGGYNLPNFDDIRRDYGAKNVIRLPMPGETLDPEFQKMWRETLTEFMPNTKVEEALLGREKLYQVLVLLHEIIGHGSGTYDVTKYGKNEDPVSALGSLGSALEEQRADLTALVFAGDQKLVDVGAYKDKAEAMRIKNLMYDYYLADFLRRTSGQRTFAEAHQRGHLLFVYQLLESGAVGWAAKDGSMKHTPENCVLVVKDYDKFHSVAVKSLGELQKIKATRDASGLKSLFAKYAPLEAIQEPWAQAVIKRGENLKINAGYVEQPWHVTQDGKYHLSGGKTLESIAPYWKER